MKQVPQIRRRFMPGSERQQNGRKCTSGLATAIYPGAEEFTVVIRDSGLRALSVICYRLA
jgi:hypothetical protein